MNEQLKKMGLFGKYEIRKANGKPIDSRAKYFVMRYDNFGSDPIHLQACRDVLLKYADKIKDHLPLLSKDLIEDVKKYNE